MERLNDDAQWIVLMGFVISIAIFFLAILLNQSVLVGQTTAESVLEFPKSDIQDLRSEVWVIYSRSMVDPRSVLSLMISKRSHWPGKQRSSRY